MAGMTFEITGIGDLIRKSRLIVPANQRSYAWEERHVRELLQDVAGEMNKEQSKGPPEYFLGTVVLVKPDESRPPQISDGQQRIATTTIVMARIRDILNEIGRTEQANSIQQDYISKIDIKTGEKLPQLGLNRQDNEFFSSVILSQYAHDVSRYTFLRQSNENLISASKVAYTYFKTLMRSYGEDLRPQILVRWVLFLKEKTTLVAVTVPDENQAFRLFETLNDRGVKAGQVDILKNFFLQKTARRLDETDAQWTELGGKIEASFPDKDDQLLLYLRHLWITKDGHTTEKQLSTSIREKIINETFAVNFVTEANSAATDYIALTDVSHVKWQDYKTTAKASLVTISNHLKVEQIKPLLFAISRFFSPEEANKAFRYAVSISVRFLIVGGRGGFLDEHYAARAHDIGIGKITKARELRDAMSSAVPLDATFEAAFATARVSKGYIARYLLRAIDQTMRGNATPEYVANEDFEAVNLEHIIPVSPPPGWGITAEEAATVETLIGNLTLLSSKTNVKIGNGSYLDKCEAYKSSPLKITFSIADEFPTQFGLAEVKQRQITLSKLAPQTWPLTFE
jgi:hypothetical protein